MNRIKYINPRTGQTASIKVQQAGYHTLSGVYRRWGGGASLPTMAKADETAHRAGFIRAGLRHRGPAARRALEVLRIQNALTDNAKLST